MHLVMDYNISHEAIRNSICNYLTKSPGMDGITLELLKRERWTVVKWLFRLFNV